MKTFKEILEEEISLYGVLDEEAQEYLLHLWPAIDRASTRFANQQTQQLQAKVLQFRKKHLLSFQIATYDVHFGVLKFRRKHIKDKGTAE